MPLLDDFEPSGLSSFGQNIAPNKRGALGAGLASGFEDLKGLGYSAGAAVADVVGADEAREWLDKQAKEKEYRSFVASRPELERIEDQSLSSALPYVGYQVAKQIPNVVGAVGMGMVAPEAAVPAALSRAGAVLPRALGGGGLEAGASIAARRAAAEAGQTFGKQIVGGAAFNEAQAVGSLYQAAREGGDENAGRTALLASPAYALAETLPEAMLVGRVAHGSGFTGNLLQRSLKAGATQGATGATSEILQTGMEQAVGKELTPEERRSQFLNAGVAGGLVEGVLGLPGGFRSRAPAPATTGQAPAQPETPTGEISQAFQANDTVAPDTRMASLLGRGVDPLSGRSTMLGGEAPLTAPITPPTVTGGTTDVAQAATGITQAEFAAKQRQQQDEANRLAREKVFQTLGAQYSPENTGQLNIFGGTLFDDAKINAFGNTLAAKFNALPETAHTVADAIAQANELTGGKVINVKLDASNPIGSVDKVMKALAKTADNFQIGHVANVQQAATILETLSRTEKGAKLDQLNAIHYALTGEDTTGFTEAQQVKSAKGAKDGKLPLQTTTGLGTVPVEGGTGEASTGGTGPVRPTEVQPVGAASVGEGPLGLQVGQLPTEGVRPSASAGTSVGVSEPVGSGQGQGQVTKLDADTRERIQSGVASLDPEDRDLWASQLEHKLGKKGALTWKDIPQDLNNAVSTVEFAGIKDGLATNPQETIALIRGTQQGNAHETNQTAQPKAKLGVPVRVKAAGKQGAPSVQPTPAPAPKAAQHEEAKLSPAEELWDDMDATGTPYASLTPALKQAWERAVETKQATGVIQEQIADQASDREQETKADGLIAGVLQMVIRPYGRLDEAAAQKKREFFQAFWGGAKLDSLADIADDMGISKDQALKWHAELPKFLEKNSAKIIAAAASVAESQGMTMRDLEQLLEDIESKRQKKAATAAQVTGEEEETGQSTSATEEPIESDTTGEEEFDVGEMTTDGGRDEGPTVETEAEAASDTNIRNRKSISLQERYNAIETNNARILKTMEAIEKAKAKNDVAALEVLEARLAKETEYAQQLNDKRTHRGEFGEEPTVTGKEAKGVDIALASMAAKEVEANKRKRNAVQVESTDEGNVREPAGGGEEVGQANAEPKKPARARKASGEEKTEHRVTFEGKAATLTIIRDKATPEKVKAVTVRVDGSRLAELNLGPQGVVSDAKLMQNLVDTESIDAATEPTQEVKTDAEKAAQAWDDVAKDIPGALMFTALTPAEQETFIEYGEENWTRADVVAEMKKLSAAQPVQGPTTEAERKDAEAHAADMGGTVVWQDGPWALIRGYSVLSGQPVYIPANGVSRWRKDIEGLPETVPIPADMRAKLIAAKKEAEAADAAQHAANPFIKFEGNGLALSSGVDRRLGGVVAGWKNLLNIKANVYITTLEDARADKDKFTGPHRAIGSAGLDANEAGSMRKMGTDYYIAFTKGTSYLKMLETLAHELGHLHQDEAFRNAPDDVQLAIREEHEKFVKANKGKTAREFVTALRARTTGRATKLPAGAQATELTEYWRSFSEWYADQVSKWATSSEKPVGVVETFFAKLGAALKKFYYSLKGKQYLPTETMKQFLDSVADRKLIIAPTNADTGTESRAILAGVRSVNEMDRDAKSEFKGRLAVAKVMDRTGDDAWTIWNRTGWYKGPEGKWRYEVPDTDAKFVGGAAWEDFPEDIPMMLEDVLDHPALFKAIPSLKDVEVIRSSNLPAGNGSYDSRTDVVRVGAEETTDSYLGAFHTLLHEIQHAVQEREGFAKGGSLEAVDPYDAQALEKLARHKEYFFSGEYSKQIRKAIELLKPFEAAHKAIREMEDKVYALEEKSGDNPTHAQVMQMEDLYGKLADAAGALAVKVGRAWAQFGGNRFAMQLRQDLYEMIGGEAEANTIMLRANYPAEELSQVTPERVDIQNQLLYKGPAVIARKIANLPKPLQAPTKVVVDTLLNSGKATMINRNEDVKHILLAAGITEDVVNGATKFMPSAQDYLNSQYERQGTRIEHEQRIQRIEEAFEKLPTELQGTGRGSVNEFIFDSTSDSKWGYVPAYNPNIKPDDEMARRFDAMPDAAQRVIKMVFDHGYQSLRLKQKAVKVAADKEFSQREADANGDQEILNEIAAERTAWESKFDRLMNIKNNMPYAYLGRYGDYVAVAKSETYVDAEELSAKGDLDAAKWLEENQSDANHYIVEFAETMAEAQAKAEQWKATGQFKHVYGAEKEVSEAFVGGSDLFMGITRLRNMLTRRIKSGELTIADQETLNALHKTVSDLYLATVSEASAHRTAMQRKNISGADKDMMRNLATRGRADAHFLASLKHNEDITDAISNMRDEAKADPTNARPYLNELLKRYANDINYKTPSVWSRTLTRMGHTWFLSFNPAFYLQQMTQTYVLSLPYMAGRLGYHRSLRAINSAYKDVVNLVKDTNVNEHLDFSKAPADVRDMLLKLVRMGKIDIGIDADAVVYANERTLTSSVMRKLNGVNNRIEAVNRATAAVAAYRGYLQRYGANNTEAATKFAAETVSNTHGSYDGFNTPRILNSNVGRVVGQFKRFQIIQLSMLGKLIKNSFNGASAEEKMVARRSLAFIASHMAVLGGALGVPFVSQLANLMTKLFGDDDEPKDLEYKLRQAIGDPTLASLLTRGVPAALGMESLGKKLAMENVASILPFTDTDFTSRSGAEKMLVGLMGPTASLGLKAADALGLVGKGEYYKGLEQALPSGFANAMKGFRFATEGITMRNGDVVLSPEEVSMVDAAFQAIGLPTGTITGRQYRQNVEKEFDKFYMTRATEIKGDYVNANREGDSSAMAEARQSWQELQDARAKNGYTKQPMSELFKAIMAAKKREASITGGVETTKANRGFVKNII